MNDMELLSLVAQAAGITIGWGRQGPVAYRGRGDPVQWNPLLNGADTFHLQVALRLRLVVHDTYVECFPHPDSEDRLIEPITSSEEAAARRATCRAAAARASDSVK